MLWNRVKISDVLVEREGRYKVTDKALNGLQRIDKIDFAGNIHLSEKPSKTDMIMVYPGDLVISGINVHKGAIAVYQGDEPVAATIHYSSYTFADEKLRVEYFKEYLKSAAFLRVLKEQVPGGIKTEIKPKHFLPLEIDLPDRKSQNELLEQFHAIERKRLDLTTELDHQRKRLKQLRQAILEEAVQGKLTSAWRDDNPVVESASELLDRIRTEKESLVMAGKMRKLKALPAIDPELLPFELPRDWVWCRFGSYAGFERGKFSARPRGDKRFFGGPYPFIQIGSLDSNGSVITASSQTLNDQGLAVSKMFEAGTIAVAIVGGTIGNLGVLGRDMCFTDSVVGVRPRPLTCQDFILLMLRCKQPTIQSDAYQRAGQPNISLPNLTDLLIPLPPLAEQVAIVGQVEALMKKCGTLEAEMDQAQTHTAQLLQSVLSEVMGGPGAVGASARAAAPEGLAVAAEHQAVYRKKRK